MHGLKTILRPLPRNPSRRSIDDKTPTFVPFREKPLTTIGGGGDVKWYSWRGVRNVVMVCRVTHWSRRPRYRLHYAKSDSALSLKGWLVVGGPARARPDANYDAGVSVDMSSCFKLP